MKVLTTREVAEIFRVDPKTVVRWVKQGRLTSTRTLGGQHRFLASEVKAALDATKSKESA